MDLVQARLVTEDVACLAVFYARLVGADVAVNEYYVEVPTCTASVGFSRTRYAEYRDCGEAGRACRDELMLDFVVADVDAEHERIAALNVEMVMPVTTQPWGNRSMIFRDPRGNLVNVFSRP